MSVPKAIRRQGRTMWRAARRLRLPGPAEARIAWAVPVCQPLVLISEVQRSGGTLLGRLFDDHPECFVHPHELQWAKKPGWPSAWPDGKPPDPEHLLPEFWIEKAIALGYYAKARGNHQPFVFDLSLFRRVLRQALAAHPPQAPRDVLNAHFTAFFNAWLDYQSLYRTPKRFVVGFAPGFLLKPQSGGFERDYPDGYLISVVRDPVSWYASAARHQRTMKSKLFAGLDDAIDLWQRSTQATLTAKAARPDRTIVIVFDDLVHRTEAVMRDIAAITGLTYTSSMLEPTFNGRSIMSNTSFTPTPGLDPSVRDRTAEVEPNVAARILEANAGLYRSACEQFGRGTRL